MTTDLFEQIATAFKVDEACVTPEYLMVQGDTDLQSWFGVTELATASIGFAGAMLAEYVHAATGHQPRIIIDRRLASLWFGFTLRPNGWELPPSWDPVAGDYRAKDRWIRLHTNAPHHREAAFSVLGSHNDKSSMGQAVAGWEANELEAAIVGANGCAAAMHTLDEWASHPQGTAVAADPLVIWDTYPSTAVRRRQTTLKRPLRGLRVLDLTRVLAGPVAGRFLAGYGADVLRIDPPDWEEPGVVPEVTLGKRCAGLDLRRSDDLDTFRQLLQSADMLLHGYRPGALDGLGFGRDRLRELNPNLIDVSLDAYGWSGPWSERRGFDSLVQMSSGIADYGMRQSGADHPVPLPVQALDHATGYLMAAAALKALTANLQHGAVLSARLSLARTAHLLSSTKRASAGPEFEPMSEADLSDDIEHTAWGPANRVRFPLQIEKVDATWDYPASDLRSAKPIWRSSQP